MKYEVINYTDVWGNSEDGFTVNDVERHFAEIEITDEMSDLDIIKAIKEDKMGYYIFCFYEIKEGTFDVTGDADRIEISHADNGFPICALIPIEEGGII